MSKIRVVLALSLILVVCATAVRAEEGGGAAEDASMDALLSAIRANRKALVAASLALSDEDATKFWPIYDRYQKEINAVGDRWAGLVQEYTTAFPDIPNDKALKLVEDYLAIEADRVRVRRAYVPEFSAVLPGSTVARLYQIENKIDAVIRYDLASTIPVIEQVGRK